jgi:hypothetical protein
MVVRAGEVDMVRGSGRAIDPYAGTWIIIAGMGLLAAASAVLLGFSFDHASAVTVATTGAILLALHFVYTKVRPDIYIGPLCGAATVLYLCSVVGGTMSLVALGTGAPLIDGTLARLDASLGFEVGQFVEWIARLPAAVFLLRVCYSGIVPVIMITAVILVLIKRSDRLWEFCFVYAGTLTGCALISAFLPAIGAFVHSPLPRELLDRLPHGAGVYYVSQFVAFRFEGQRIINLLDFDGVVNFPSFHCCMALLTAYAYRGLGRISAVAYAFNGLVIIASVPIGGHYLIDLIGGAAIWVPFVALTRPRARVPARASAQIPACPPSPASVSAMLQEPAAR